MQISVTSNGRYELHNRLRSRRVYLIFTSLNVTLSRNFPIQSIRLLRTRTDLSLRTNQFLSCVAPLSSEVRRLSNRDGCEAARYLMASLE